MCNIQIRGLKDGSHEFSFPLEKEFFEKFESALILDASLVADIVLEKRRSWMNLNFEINGTVTVPCDRCLDPLSLEIYCSESLPVRESGAAGTGGGRMDNISGDSESQGGLSEDVVLVEPDASELDLSQLLYDYVCINIPLVRRHPNGECNKQMIEKLAKFSAGDKSEIQSSDAKMSNSVDSPFAALKSMLENKK